MIDNDFFSHAIEMNTTPNNIFRILKEVFSELEIEPTLHPLVYQNEVLISNTIIKAVLDNNIIKVASFDDIHQNDEGIKLYYSFLITELYKKLTGLELDLQNDTVFSFWKKGMSLGEIHSLTTCLICGCSIFLSDDGDSQRLKHIIENNSLGKVEVHNRQAVVDMIREKGTILARKELRSFAHSQS